MSGKIEISAKDSCNNCSWWCCRESKIKVSDPNKPFPTNESETEVRTMTIYRHTRKATPPAEPSS